MKLNRDERKYLYDGDLDAFEDVSAIITTPKGILTLEGTDLSIYEKGQRYFGITRDKHGTFWCARNGESYLYRFRYIGGEIEAWGTMADLRPGSSFSHRGIHQIDFIDDELFVMDTYNNRCLVLMPMPTSLDDDTKKEIKVVRVIYPRGRHAPVGSYLKNGLHGHFNSIYSIGHLVYILAHDNTIKTKRLSSIYVFDKHTMRLKSKVPEVGSSAHNLVVDTSEAMYMCDSGNHCVVSLNHTSPKKVWVDTEFSSFVRGLAINDDVMLIGGSFRNEHKDTADGHLFLVDKKTRETLCTLLIPDIGQIHDIRFTGLDYGYSNTWRKT